MKEDSKNCPIFLIRKKGKHLYYWKAHIDEENRVVLNSEKVGKKGEEIPIVVSDSTGVQRFLEIQVEIVERDGFSRVRADESIKIVPLNEDDRIDDLLKRIKQGLLETGNLDYEIMSAESIFPVYSADAAEKTTKAILKELNLLKAVRIGKDEKSDVADAKKTPIHYQQSVELLRSSQSPWDNDQAADWFGELFSQTNLDVYVRETLENSLDESNIDEIRAAIFILIALGRTYIWPITDLDDDLELAEFRLQELISSQRGQEEKKSLKLELKAIQGLKSNNSAEDRTATTKVWKEWLKD